MTQETRDSVTADLERALRSLAADDRELQVPLHVHSAVMQAWDATMTAVRRRPVVRHPWRTAVVAGAAAAVFVSAVIVYRSGTDARPTDAVPIVAVEQRRSTPNEAPPPAEEQVAQPPTRPRRGQPVSPVVRAGRAQSGIVLVADPVLDASALCVVRVRMPRSTLAHLGIPIADPEASGSVDLEVLVGEDGIARTIRRAVPVTGSDPQE